ncbi:MAG: hypothetical protein Tsb0020_13350 [Haliangiales bacterium]
MDQREREILIEAAASAQRTPVRGALPVHPAWYDLDAAGREEAFEVTRELRLMEAALDPDGQSTTVRAVLSRIRAGAQR